MIEFYDNYFSETMKGNVRLLTDKIKVLLVSVDYVFNAGHSFRSDLYSEVRGVGYEPGGKELTKKTVSLATRVENGVSRRVSVFDAEDLRWLAATIRARRAILYKDSGDPGTDPLIGSFDFVDDVVSTNDLFLVRWLPEGIFDFGAKQKDAELDG